MSATEYRFLSLEDVLELHEMYLAEKRIDKAKLTKIFEKLAKPYSE
ncbi:MAG: hypothetical protein KF799_11220 [Bdellovibrionales bacterium]|nr:hypothetical protein [Bdellovibrionales bacterium]